MANLRRVYELIQDVPMVHKGKFVFCDYSGAVYWIDEKGNESDYALRSGLAGYLWLLRTEEGYFKFIEQEFEEFD